MSYFQGRPDWDESGSAELDMWLVDQALGMTQGYVLDFSDRTFNDFVKVRLGIDITAPTYTVDGTSKARRMRAFLRALVPGAQAEVLRVFWSYRQSRPTAFEALEPRVETAFLQMIAKLEGDTRPIDLGAIEKFTEDPSLSDLVDAISREIQANSPHTALDRLHTYTMKKFADLLRADGVEVSPKGQPPRAGGTIHQQPASNWTDRRCFGPDRQVGNPDFRTLQRRAEQSQSRPRQPVARTR
ncbi:hypothetical protein [uncultured Brevundimonas sp.]|uniref:hypothetical protein n=1 Tax=uncultured Brevundimonas sp. TaxID=213418 RepID=UPI0025D4196C|nr:hypothetical protein [uncultured Brevundimonas sp.]